MHLEQQQYIYTYGYRPEEKELFHLETRSFFGKDASQPFLKSPVKIHPDRSPFMRELLEILYEGDDPCCGIGTILVEALSMDINIVGRDINHFVVRSDIAGVERHYDVAILDMPFSLIK